MRFLTYVFNSYMLLLRLDAKLASGAVEDNAADLKPKNEKSNKHLGIVNGIVTDPAVHPYMVAWVNNLGNIRCGASLIAEDIVLTAAHCWEHGLTMYLRAGVHDLYDENDDYEEFIVESADQYVHELYDPNSFNNDFMIAKLPSSSSYKWVTLNTDPDEPSDGEILHVMGWGAIETDGPPSDVLQYADVIYETNAVCTEKYENAGIAITTQMLCAADAVEGQDSCQGDSGGPLVIFGDPDTGDDDIQVGVVSFGIGCAHAKFPGVYARISTAYDWIRIKVCTHSDNPPSEYDCASGTSTPTPSGEGTSTPTPSSTAGGCANRCGHRSDEGCWCDTACHFNGDCCEDVCDQCHEICYGTSTPTSSPTADGCANRCDGQSDQGCWCDSICHANGDCCEDACDQCDQGCPVPNQGKRMPNQLFSGNKRSSFKRSD